MHTAFARMDGISDPTVRSLPIRLATNTHRGNTMQEIIQLVDRYLTIWHETDAAQRHQRISQLWAEDAIQCTRSREMRGHQALEERVTAAHNEFVITGGFRFRRVGDVLAHHDAVTFTWEMVPAAGGDAAATGTIFLLLSTDGRICGDYQF